MTTTRTPRKATLWISTVTTTTTMTTVLLSLMCLMMVIPIEGFLLQPLSSISSSADVFTTTSMNRGRHTTTTRLLERPGGSEKDGSATVRFSGTEGLTSTTTNPLDAVLTVLASDIASIALGLMGLVVVVAHRVSMLDDILSAESMSVQTRTDLLAVFACGSVLLNGITKLDVTAAMAESVILEGTTLSKPELYPTETIKDDEEQAATTIVWALESILTATPALTAVLLERDSSVDSSPSSSPWRVLARGGTVPAGKLVPDSTPILDRVSSVGNAKETYLPTLQALPGKRELPYLPSNAQLALLVPILDSGGGDEATTTSTTTTKRVLVLGSNRAKSFSPRDVAWCRIVAERMVASNQ